MVENQFLTVTYFVTFIGIMRHTMMLSVPLCVEFTVRAPGHEEIFSNYRPPMCLQRRPCRRIIEKRERQVILKGSDQNKGAEV